MNSDLEVTESYTSESLKMTQGVLGEKEAYFRKITSTGRSVNAMIRFILGWPNSSFEFSIRFAEKPNELFT